jgi:hypothetical protein
MKWQVIAVAAALAVATQAAAAEKKYGPGASDTEIKLGQTSPFSGPASAYSVIAKAQAAYFKMINDQGGVNGRKINLITLDDAYSPPKTVEQTRKLVEQEEVAVILNPLGTPTGLAVRKYLNDKKVPQLFVGAGATLWGDHKQFPWSIGFQPSYQAETAVYAKYVLKNKPDAKIALFYQNDDAGKDYGNGFKKGLGPEHAKMVIAEATSCSCTRFRNRRRRQSARLARSDGSPTCSSLPQRPPRSHPCCSPPGSSMQRESSRPTRSRIPMILSGRTTRTCKPGMSSCESISLTATVWISSSCTAMWWRRRRCRFSSSAATISLTRTS